MKYETIRLVREKEHSDALRRLFNADVIGRLLRESRVEDPENYIRATLEGHGLHITQAMAPRLHTICQQVERALAFTEPVEYYVLGSSELNCSAVPRLDEGQPHLVIIHSALVERFDDAELRFVIGHELGHLVSRNSELERIIEFVFPGEDMPLTIRDQVDTWSKLSEMTADRFGYLSEPDLHVCLSVFFKLSSGLDTKAIRFDPAAYLDEMTRVLDAFRTEIADHGLSHPVNPIRVKALELFAQSELPRGLAAGRDAAVPDRDLQRGMEGLVELLVTKGHSPLTAARRRFIAAAGLLVAGVDEKIGPDELDAILEPLAVFTHQPARYFRDMLSRRDPVKVFHESAATILEANPAERFEMLEYMVSVALADRELEEREVELLFTVGQDVFGFQRKEIAQLLAQALQQSFVPRVTLSLPPGRGDG
jgi:uncharacterized tellurite resistance protein B-like protein